VVSTQTINVDGAKSQLRCIKFLSDLWGDGMRIQVGVSSLQTEANPHYGTGKGTTMYRFVRKGEYQK
jgi:hypothetical protein